MSWPISKQNWGDASECNARINGETFTVQMGECDAVIVSLGASIKICEQKAHAIAALPDCLEALKLATALDPYSNEGVRAVTEMALAALKKAGCV